MHFTSLKLIIKMNTAIWISLKTNKILRNQSSWTKKAQKGKKTIKQSNVKMITNRQCTLISNERNEFQNKKGIRNKQVCIIILNNPFIAVD